MKIEMGESLMLSYLKHVQGCQVIQTNWKSSPTWKYDKERENKAKELIFNIGKYFQNSFAGEYQDEVKKCFGKIKNYNNGLIDFSLFNDYNNDANLERLLLQGECDLIGIRIENNKINAFAAEVAYHSKGLGYGPKNKAIMKVAKKMLRAVIDLYLFFEVDEGDVIFVSPVIKDGVLAPLRLVIDKLQDILINNNFNFNLALICNLEFKDKVLEPLIAVSSDISDTTELFMRSHQLEHIVYSNVTHASNESNAGNNNEYYKKAIAKIPKWAERPEQINYKIIRSYFKLSDKYGEVALSEMKKLCRNKEAYPDMYIPTDKSFKSNYSQMKIDGAKSHGKVFEDVGEYVRVWSSVENVLMQYKEKFCR